VSAEAPAARLTVSDIRRMYTEGRRIAMLTAYDYPTARVLDEAGIPMLLVGDSLAQLVLGYETTVRVSMAEMLHHTKAVVRGSKRALVIGDMPFLSYGVSPEATLEHAGAFLREGGTQAVKIEGGTRSARTVETLTKAGIAVMGHIGLTPQSATMLGGFRAQGRTAAKARQLLEDARTLEQAGCFALVLEAVPAPVAAKITETLSIPTIGIGSGPDCDGQVLVYHDLLGLYQGRSPRFVKRYAELAAMIQQALERYAADVRSGSFPEDEHTYSIPDEELASFKGALAAEHD
jgi:3-methyl-2-oxobutanoate hydroxymethyltransferase